MREVIDDLHVGDDRLCVEDAQAATVHACKRPCHRNAVGYRGDLSSSHDEYLTAKRGTDLYLNLVDMDRKQKHRFMQPIVKSAMEHIHRHIEEREVRVHCSKGRSRAPTIALLYMAKRADALPSSSYEEAREAFRDEVYPEYRPGRGIDLYLEDYWSQIN